MYSETVVISEALKKNFKRFPYRSSRYGEDERVNGKLCFFLAEYGKRIKRNCKILQRLCDSSKSTTGKIYPVAKDGLTLVKAVY